MFRASQLLYIYIYIYIYIPLFSIYKYIYTHISGSEIVCLVLAWRNGTLCLLIIPSLWGINCINCTVSLSTEPKIPE
jgi:hypothetical protein